MCIISFERLHTIQMSYSIGRMSLLAPLLLLAGIMSALCMPVTENECKPLTKQELHQKWINYTMNSYSRIHESLFMTTTYETIIQSELNHPNSTTSLVHLYGDTSCDMEPEKSAVQSRSFCPWYQVINHDEDRYPVDLVEARTSCDGNCGGQAGLSGQCQPVYYNVRVLRRSGQCEWTTGWQRLATGYTCTVPRTMPTIIIPD